MSVPVIDMWAPIVPSDEIIEDLQSGFPTEQLQYLEVFTKTTVSDEQFGSYAQALRRSDDQILVALDEAGITHSLITGFDERSTCGVTFVHNESVAALTDRHPNRFIPFAGADIMRGSSALAALEHWVVKRHRSCVFPLLRQVRRTAYPAQHPHVRKLDADARQ